MKGQHILWFSEDIIQIFKHLKEFANDSRTNPFKTNWKCVKNIIIKYVLVIKYRDESQNYNSNYKISSATIKRVNEQAMNVIECSHTIS